MAGDTGNQDEYAADRRPRDLPDAGIVIVRARWRPCDQYEDQEVVAYGAGVADDFFVVRSSDTSTMSGLIPKTMSAASAKSIERQAIWRCFSGSLLPDSFIARDQDQPWLYREIVHAMMERGDDVFDDLARYTDSASSPLMVAHDIVRTWETAVIDGLPDGASPPGLVEPGLVDEDFEMWALDATIRWCDTGEQLNPNEARLLRLVAWYFAPRP